MCLHCCSHVYPLVTEHLLIRSSANSKWTANNFPWLCFGKLVVFKVWRPHFGPFYSDIDCNDHVNISGSLQIICQIFVLSCFSSFFLSSLPSSLFLPCVFLFLPFFMSSLNLNYGRSTLPLGHVSRIVFQ